jgi:hypothetical protein
MEGKALKKNVEDLKGKYVLGIEGSANKIGVGVVDFNGKIFSNPR